MPRVGVQIYATWLSLFSLLLRLPAKNAKSEEMELKLAAISFAVVMAAALIASSEAREFVVGGDEGWKENPSESFDLWARRNRFQINDTLVFRYKEEDSVLAVSEEDYKTCNTSKPVRSFRGGETKFTLNKAGPFYFIGGAAGRCGKGQKLVVVVMSERRPKAAEAPAPPPGGVTAAEGPGEEAPPPVSASAGVSVCVAAVVSVLGGTAFLI